ncbi:MAG: competence protein CoiA family protein, partial [Polyangiaceae bacterium]
MSGRGFAVPFARTDDGRLVSPDDARRAVGYRCPQCDGGVHLHAGERKRRHFHHRASESCTAETVLHATAKQM